jgi:two-component system phosphate regulon response regulator OmpR
MTDRSTAHILVVDDDPKVRKLLRRCFEGEGYGVSEAGDGDELRREIGQRKVDLITLDLTLPGQDGLTLAREIRSTSKIPIIMVTGKGDTIDRVVGLEIGADDYIAKPFHLREVLARVRSVLRRADSGSDQPTPNEADRPTDGNYRFADWSLDLGMRELRRADGSLQDLTTAEFGVLEMFVTHPQKVLSRDAIMDLLKGREWTPLDRAIDTQIARLRKKIEADLDNPRLIKTIRGVGYMFATEVEKS